MTTMFRLVARVARRVARGAGDAGDAGFVSYPPRKNAPPPLLNTHINAIPVPALGSWGLPWSTASVIFAGDAGDADDNSYPVGKLSERQNIKWAESMPRITRITRKGNQIRGSFLALSHAGNPHRVLSLGSGRRAYATPRQTSPKMTRYCAPSAGDDLTASRGCLDESKPSTPCALRIREGGAGSP